MRYALLFHYTEEGETTLGPETIQAGMDAFAAYAATLHEAGVLISGEVLGPSTLTTTVQAGEQGTLIQDGPFADTKEQLGGIMVIEVSDLDAAIEWAARAPAAQWGTVEVRPGAVHVKDGAWMPSR